MVTEEQGTNAKCLKCNRSDTLFDVYREIDLRKNKYLHTICCKCGEIVKGEEVKWQI